jgi:hypothetical protein
MKNGIQRKSEARRDIWLIPSCFKPLYPARLDIGTSVTLISSCNANYAIALQFHSPGQKLEKVGRGLEDFMRKSGNGSVTSSKAS